MEQYQTGLRRNIYRIGVRQLDIIDKYILPNEDFEWVQGVNEDGEETKVKQTKLGYIFKTKPLILFTKLKADICRYIAENGFD